MKNVKQGSNNSKKIIAREILLLFGTILLSALIYLILLLWNTYFEHSISRITISNKNIHLELKKFPEDRIGNLYRNGLHNKMVVNYKVNESSYAIPKDEESEFLADFPKALIQPPVGKKFSLFRDSIYNFDYVDSNEFRILMRDSLYRLAFYDFASREYDIGTREEYHRKICEGLKYNDRIIATENQLLKKLKSNSEKKNYQELKLINQEIILERVLFVWFILLGLLYPIRFIYLTLKWSVETLKSK